MPRFTFNDGPISIVYGHNDSQGASFLFPFHRSPAIARSRYIPSFPTSTLPTLKLPAGYHLTIIDTRLTVEASTSSDPHYRNLHDAADDQRNLVDIAGHGIYFWMTTKGEHDHCADVEVMELFWRLYGVSELEIGLMMRGLMPQGLGHGVEQLFGRDTEVIGEGTGDGEGSGNGGSYGNASGGFEGWENETAHPESQMGSRGPSGSSS